MYDLTNNPAVYTFRIDGPGGSQIDQRFNRPPEPQPPQQQQPPRTSEPPPWARGAATQPAQRSPPTGNPPPRPGFSSAQPTPYQPPQMSQAGARPLQPGDAIRAAPIIQPYRPPQPSQNDYRPPQPAGPRGPAAYRPPQPVRPYGPQGYGGPSAGYPGPQGYPGPTRPPMNHMSANPWNKEAEDRR